MKLLIHPYNILRSRIFTSRKVYLKTETLKTSCEENKRHAAGEILSPFCVWHLLLCNCLKRDIIVFKIIVVIGGTGLYWLY